MFFKYITSSTSLKRYFPHIVASWNRHEQTIAQQVNIILLMNTSASRPQLAIFKEVLAVIRAKNSFRQSSPGPTSHYLPTKLPLQNHSSHEPKITRYVDATTHNRPISLSPIISPSALQLPLSLSVPHKFSKTNLHRPHS